MSITYKSNPEEILAWFYNRANFRSGKAATTPMSLVSDDDKLLVALYTRIQARHKKWVLRYKEFGSSSEEAAAYWDTRASQTPGQGPRAKMWQINYDPFDVVPDDFDLEDITPSQAVLDIYEKYGKVVHIDSVYIAKEQRKPSFSPEIKEMKRLWSKLSFNDKKQAMTMFGNSISASLNKLELERSIPAKLINYIHKLYDRDLAKFDVRARLADDHKNVARLALLGFRMCTVHTSGKDDSYEPSIFFPPQAADELVSAGEKNLSMAYTSNSGIKRITSRQPKVKVILPQDDMGNNYIKLPSLNNAIAKNWTDNREQLLEFLSNDDNFKLYWLHNKKDQGFILDFNVIALSASVALKTPINPITLKWIHETDMKSKLPKECILSKDQPALYILDKNT